MGRPHAPRPAVHPFPQRGGARALPASRFPAALHIFSLALLAWMIWASLAPSAGGGAARTADGGTLIDSLRAWTVDPRAQSVHVAFDTAPGDAARAWLAALRRAGASVRWSSSTIPPIALAVEPVNDPAGGARVLIGAPPGARVALADGVGPVDTVAVDAPAAEVRWRVFQGITSATLGRQATRAVARDSLEPRAVLVLARAGWEAKFVIAALEERGWAVAARLAVAPGKTVSQGRAVFDTARVGVVLALDTTAARDAARIARFVRNGGGLVLAGDAARSPAFAPLAPGGVGPRVPAATIAFTSGAPRRALGFFPVVRLARDAIVLERRDGRVAAAARRSGAGRVVQVGYDETWRWRLAGGDEAPESHRAWWSAVVGSAAYRAARAAAADTLAVEPAPLAATVDALGAPVPPPRAAGTAPPARRLHPWMLVLLFASLLAEWTYRRLRGVP